MKFQNFSQEAEVAVAAVRRAADICRHVRATIDPGVLEKRDRSPVTIADFASQAVVCKGIDAAFPDDPIIAEEDSAALSEPQNTPFIEQIATEVAGVDSEVDASNIRNWIDRGTGGEGASRFWTLDPIDGTKGFLRGGQYAVSLALLIDNELQVAAVACPHLAIDGEETNQPGAIFVAVRGEGAWGIASTDDSDFRQIFVTPTSDSAAARFCESVESGHTAHDTAATIAELLHITQPPVRMDSQAKYAVVARGDADIYMRLPTRPNYQEKIWDHAGGTLLVEEAGGCVTDIDGKPLDWSHGSELVANRGVIVTNGHLHDAVIDAVKRSQE